ncbi:MAG: STAS domain-containing protein [Aggregatilineales bacterium]
MPQAKLTANVRRISSQISIIDIQGDVNALAENVLTDAFAGAGSGGIPIIALNFTGLEYMNSSGIGLLVTLLIRAQRQRQRLIAFGLSEHYQQIFELTRLNEAISLYPTEAETLAALNTLKPQR